MKKKKNNNSSSVACVFNYVFKTCKIYFKTRQSSERVSCDWSTFGMVCIFFFVFIFATKQMHHVRSMLGLIHIMGCVCFGGCVNVQHIICSLRICLNLKGLDFPLMTKTHIYLVQITEIIFVILFFSHIAPVLIHFWCKWKKKKATVIYLNFKSLVILWVFYKNHRKNNQTNGLKIKKKGNLCWSFNACFKRWFRKAHAIFQLK